MTCLASIVDGGAQSRVPFAVLSCCNGRDGEQVLLGLSLGEK